MIGAVRARRAARGRSHSQPDTQPIFRAHPEPPKARAGPEISTEAADGVQRVTCHAGWVSNTPATSAAVHYLEVAVMAVPEAARQLDIPLTTLKHWLDGHTIGDNFYGPVLRHAPGPVGADVTWGEMVEADYLRAYRARGVSLQALRPFIEHCREEFGLRYPLAHLRPFTDGRKLLLELQRAAQLTDQLRVVYQLHDGQLELDHRADSWLQRVERGSDHDAVLRIHPDGADSPVVHDPDISSGAATVNGIRTQIIREQYEVGEDTREIAQTFGLPVGDVLAALNHEKRLRPLQVA